MDNNEIKDNELNKVSGGLSVGFNDHCHFVPSKWVRSATYLSTGEPTDLCRSCIYNPHRDWEYSSCTYSEQNNEDTNN